jgi:RluA family pseudouridine synthase
VRTGETVEIHFEFDDVPAPPADDRKWSSASPEVLFQDDEYLLVNKTPHVACSDDGRDPLALAVWLREYLAGPIAAGTARPEPCHRLDRGTTGIVAVALTPAAFDRFRRGLEGGRVHKTYEVAVAGVPDRRRFDCDFALVRQDRVDPDEPRMVVGDGRPARTEFERLAAHDGRTLLAATPVTGRTHQIRAHCLALGFPVLGDRRYGRGHTLPGLDHQLLHARALEFEGHFSVRAGWPSAETRLLQDCGLTT